MTDSTTTTPATAAPLPMMGQRRRISALGLLSKLGPLIGLAFVYLLFTIITPLVSPFKFATLPNFELMLRQTTVVGISALGMTIIIVSGGIDLSVGSVLALVVVVVAWVLDRSNGQDVVRAAIIGVIAGVLCYALLGFLVTVCKLNPFIASLGLWGAIRGVAKGTCELYQDLYNSASSANIQVNSDAWKQTWLKTMVLPLTPDHRWMIFPGEVWLMIILAILMAALMRYTRFGRHIFALGSNEQTARLCGVKVNWTKFLIYTLAGLTVAIAGVLEFGSISIGDPTDRIGAELDVIAAVIIGGASLTGGSGSISGSLIGALIMTAVANGCTKVGLSNWVQEIATGVIIILAVVLDQLRHRKPA